MERADRPPGDGQVATGDLGRGRSRQGADQHGAVFVCWQTQTIDHSFHLRTQEGRLAGANPAAPTRYKFRGKSRRSCITSLRLSIMHTADPFPAKPLATWNITGCPSHVMKTGMVRLRRHHDKILRCVVAAIPVNMVYDFTLDQRAPQFLLGHDTMKMATAVLDITIRFSAAALHVAASRRGGP